MGSIMCFFVWHCSLINIQVICWLVKRKNRKHKQYDQYQQRYILQGCIQSSQTQHCRHQFWLCSQNFLLDVFLVSWNKGYCFLELCLLCSANRCTWGVDYLHHYNQKVYYCHHRHEYETGFQAYETQHQPLCFWKLNFDLRWKLDSSYLQLYIAIQQQLQVTTYK